MVQTNIAMARLTGATERHAMARRTAGIGGATAATAAAGGNISVEIVVKDTSALGKAIAKSIKDSKASMLPGRYHR